MKYILISIIVLLIAIIIPITILILINRKKKIKVWLNALIATFSSIFILSSFILIYFSINYKASNTVKPYLISDNEVEVKANDNWYEFDNLSNNDDALIFYGGAKVEETSYAPLCNKIAHQGIDVYLIKSPFYFALLNINGADAVASTSEYKNLYLMGHSLGGTTAATYLAKTSYSYKGIIFLASYPTKKIDDSLRCLTIYGSNDLVLNKDEYNKNISNLPKDYQKVVIDGGNHAFFGDYGSQSGDGQATITREEQINITTNEIVKLIKEYFLNFYLFLYFILIKRSIKMSKDNSKKIKKVDNEYIIDFIKTIKGKRIHIYKKGFKSKEEALNYLPLLLHKRVSESTKIEVSENFRDFFLSHLEHRGRRVSKSTLISIKTLVSQYFGNVLDAKTSEVFQVHNIIGLYKEIIERKDITEKTKNHVIGEIRFMVDYALFLKIISPVVASDDKAILENISITKAKRKQKECYSLKQLEDFFSVIEDENDLDMFKVFSYLGARISEFIGLTWDCYDPINKTIEIKQQVLYQQMKEPVLTTSLKTKESYRKCKLNSETYEMLEKRRKICKKGYIFPRSSSNIYTSYSKTKLRNKMISYMKKANLPLMSPHGFRHTKATMFMAVCTSMAEVKAAARFLGHSVTTMIETYAHEEDNIIDLLINRLDEKSL